MRRSSRVALFAACASIYVVVYSAAWVGLMRWLERSPSVALLTFAAVTAVALPLGGFLANRLFVARWIWDHFASNYARGDIRSAPMPFAEGYGVTSKRPYHLRTAATAAGIVVESLLLSGSRPTATIPWSVVSRITRGTITSLGGKPCPPMEFAHLYLWRPSDGQALVPWSDNFDAYIPEKVGLERVQSGRAL